MDISDRERVLVINKCLRRQGLQSSLMQLGRCKVKLKIKIFPIFLLPGKGAVLLGLLSLQLIDLLSMNCSTIDASQRRKR